MQRRQHRGTARASGRPVIDTTRARAEQRPFRHHTKRLIMPSSINSTSTFHSAYTAPSHDDTQSPSSVSQNVSQSSRATNASLTRLSSRASTTVGSYVTAAGSSAFGSEAESVYESAVSRRPRRTMSDIGSTTRSRLSHRGSESSYAANSTLGSEASWAAEGAADDVAHTLSQAGEHGTNAIRRSTDSSEHDSRDSDWIDIHVNQSVRGSTSSRPSSVSSEHHSRGSDWIDIHPHGASQGSVAGSDRGSDIAQTLSDAGTPSERSFHLSQRSSIADALGNGRLGYSSDSSRRLTSYESSSRATDHG